MKYIDAEKLIAEMERRITATEEIGELGRANELLMLETFITSLQQEQPKDKQIVIITESHGDANIEWDCRSLDDVMALLKSAESFITDKQIEKIAGPGSGPDYATTEGRYSYLFKRRQARPEENKQPNKRARVNYAICEMQAFKPLREAIVLDDYVYDEDKCYRENLLNYIHAIPENRLAEIRSYLKGKGWWPYDDDADWTEPEQPEVDLEKEYKRFIDCDNGRSMYDCARHFAKWGATHLKR